MPSRPSLIDLLLTNPHGWGNAPPRPQEPAYQDDAGNSYGFDGATLDRWRTPQEQPQYNPSLTDSLVNIATSPAKLAYGMVAEPYNALARLGDNFVTDDGRLGLPNPQNPENQTDMATLLMTGFGSNALNPASAIPKGALGSGAMRETPSWLSGVEENIGPVRAYHGTIGDLEGGLFSRSKGGHNTGNSVSRSGVSFDTDPKVAAFYAKLAAMNKVYMQHVPDAKAGDLARDFDAGMALERRPDLHNEMAIYPVEVTGRGATFSDENFGSLGPEGLAERLETLKALGYDYARFPNENWRGYELNVWNPGTVRSATTGEVLFSDTGRPSLLGSALAAENANYLDRFRY